MNPYYERDGIVIYHGKAEGVLPSLPAKSIDACITDPPYAINIDKLNPWDRDGLDVPAITSEVARITRDFYAVFGQLPTLLDWSDAARSERLHFCEHVVWVKRSCTPMHRLKRGHESVLVYATGRRKHFYTTTGPYEDVKVPGVLFDVISIEGIQRHIADLRRKADGIVTTRVVRGEGGNPAFSGKYAPNCVTDRSPRLANFTNVWSFLPVNQSRRQVNHHHPTEKPIEIMHRLVEMLTAGANATVLDPFMGTGTTLVAAYQSGRRAIGIEQDEQWCEIAAKRLQQAVLPLEMAAG